MAIKIDKARFKIQWRDPATLVPNPHNHRRHPERQRDVLRVALGDEGWLDPLIFNKRTGRLIDGHARTEEAIAQGVTEVPVIEIDVDEATERKILVRHDRIGALAELDLEVLRGNVEGLEAEGMTLEGIGWDSSIFHPAEPTPPADFKEFDETIPTEHVCPKCGYRWSGKSEVESGGESDEDANE
jgi:hypothetical protein